MSVVVFRSTMHGLLNHRPVGTVGIEEGEVSPDVARESGVNIQLRQVYAVVDTLAILMDEGAAARRLRDKSGVHAAVFDGGDGGAYLRDGGDAAAVERIGMCIGIK